MKFKFISRNAYRDLARNLRRICISTDTAEEKDAQFRKLYESLKINLQENSKWLNNQTAFSPRCKHWNQLDKGLNKPVTNMKNPWLRLKRQFENAVNTLDNDDLGRSVSESLAWFYHTPYLDWWIKDR